jgi:hypothetical protein
MTEAIIVIETVAVDEYDADATKCDDGNKTTNPKAETTKPYSLESIFGGLKLDCVEVLKMRTETNGNPIGPTEVRKDEGNYQNKINFA